MFPGDAGTFASCYSAQGIVVFWYVRWFPQAAPPDVLPRRSRNHWYQRDSADGQGADHWSASVKALAVNLSTRWGLGEHTSRSLWKRSDGRVAEDGPTFGYSHRSVLITSSAEKPKHEWSIDIADRGDGAHVATVSRRGQVMCRITRSATGEQTARAEAHFHAEQWIDEYSARPRLRGGTPMA